MGCSANVPAVKLYKYTVRGSRQALTENLCDWCLTSGIGGRWVLPLEMDSSPATPRFYFQEGDLA